MRALLDETTDAAPRALRNDYASLQQRNRVRPKPGFVARVVAYSGAAVVGITLGLLGAVGVLPFPVGAEIGLFGMASTALALIVGDSLSQETTTNHPMPQNRAGGYFLATLLGAYGLGFGALVAFAALPVWGIVFAALGVISSIVLFAFLGATQTNRHKAWTREALRKRAAQPVRARARDRGALRRLHRRHLARDVRSDRRARLHGRLVVGAARLRRRLRRHDAPARAHALHPRQVLR